MDQFLEVALDYGAAGLFIAYLVWAQLRAEKRSDANLANFMAQIDAIRAKSEDDEKALRQRYDMVITGLQEERTQLRSNLSRQVAKVEERIEGLKQTTDGILINQESLLGLAKDEVAERKARSAAASMVRRMNEKPESD